MMIENSFLDVARVSLELQMDQHSHRDNDREHPGLTPGPEDIAAVDRMWAQLEEEDRQKRAAVPADYSSLYATALTYFHRFGWSVVPMDGNKRPLVSWRRFVKRYRLGDSATVEYEKFFRTWRKTKGLAVICGSSSDNLCVRDFDTMESYDRWATLQPELAKTLPTSATARGMHVFFRSLTVKKTSDYGNGELRASGLVILPPSLHPSGKLYRWVIEPTPYNLVVIKDVVQKNFCDRETEKTQISEYSKKTECIERSNENRRREVVALTPEMRSMLEDALPAAVEDTRPTGEGQRNNCIFSFARRLRGIVGETNIDAVELEFTVREWHRQALPHIQTKPFEESWIDFLKGWDNVRFAYGTGPVELAMQHALSSAPPSEANQFEMPVIKQLVGLLKELQKQTGDREFYLSCRTAAKLLGVSPATANRYLYLLIRKGFLIEVEKGTKEGRASRYRYVGGP